MNKLKLSIILPVYNVEPYLKKCIRSLENQDIPKDTYEIICINDGSPDNCKQIIIDLQKEYSNIILIDQENQGVSVARNNGIKIAKGDFIMFVDTDDAIEEDIMNEFLQTAIKNDLDVVYSPFVFVDINGNRNKFFFKNEKVYRVMEGTELYFSVRGADVKDPDHSVAILLRRKLLLENNLFYLENVPVLEDGEFIARLLCLTKRGMVFNKPFYLRLNRPGSAMSNFKSDKAIEGYVKAALNLKQFKKNHRLNANQKGLINGRIVKFVVLALDATLGDYTKYRIIKKQLKEEGLFSLDLENVEKGTYFDLGNLINSKQDTYYYWRRGQQLIKSIKRRLN